MYHLRRIVIISTFFIISWFALTALHKHLDPNTRKSDEEREDARWIATSKYWLDRQSCRYIGLCGVAHWHPDPAARPWNKRRQEARSQKVLDENYESAGNSEESPIWEDVSKNGERKRPGDWADTTVLKDVPQYVLDHAPLIHLYSGEQFWPTHIAEHLRHVTPHVNHTSLHLEDEDHTVWNLHEVNKGHPNRWLYMQSKDDIEERPDWLGGGVNKPIPYDDEDEDEGDDDDDDEGELGGDEPSYNEYQIGKEVEREDEENWWDTSHPSSPEVSEAKNSSSPNISKPKDQSLRKPSGGPSYRQDLRLRGLTPQLPKPAGYSPAPVILILVDKGNGIVDAFWFFFYSFNLGTTVMNIRFGNHVGDWEHTLIRFHNGVPKAVFCSAHSGGLAYAYGAVEKKTVKGSGERPVLYSARGSHAMYATPGKHPYVLPFGMLKDVTDRGPLWDPSLNYLAYHYNTNITRNMDAEFADPPAASPSSTSASSNTVPPTPIPKPLSDDYPRMENLTKYQHSILQPASSNPRAPMGWWWYAGRWGDKFYELADLRQWRFVGQYHYVNGPYGPRFKNLGRSRVCQSGTVCRIVDDLDGGGTWINRRRR